MEYYGMIVYLMDYYGLIVYIMEYYGMIVYLMEYYGLIVYIMDYYGMIVYLMDYYVYTHAYTPVGCEMKFEVKTSSYLYSMQLSLQRNPHCSSCMPGTCM